MPLDPALGRPRMKRHRLRPVQPRSERLRPSQRQQRQSRTDTNLSLKVGDLFAGAGGLSLGFHLEGLRSVFFNEIDKDAAATFQSNFPEAKGFVGPIEKLSAAALLSEAGLVEGELDVLVGGPPCQGFSINAPARTSSDSRNHLFKHYVRLVLEGLRPKFVVFENVPGLVSFEGGQTLRDVCKAFVKAGYQTTFRVLNACHYGVPQERWRLFIVANRLGIDFDFPFPTHYSLSRPNFSGGSTLTFRSAVRGADDNLLFETVGRLRAPTTVGEAIADLPAIPSGGGVDEASYDGPPSSAFQAWARKGSKRVMNHHCVDIAAVNHARMRHVPPGGSWRDIPEELLPEGMKLARRSDHTRRYGRLDPTGVACTVMTKCDPHWGTVIHQTQDRVISVREAARFQSFPDTFRFLGPKASQYRQVGNAVPPLLARALAKRIRRYLDALGGLEILSDPPKASIRR